MTRQKWILLVVTLLLIGGAGALLAHVKDIQTLGRPGVKTQPLPGSKNLEVMLPDDLPDYRSEKQQVAKIVTDTLPKDTSFGERVYRGADGFNTQVSVVLMGSDRTSMHKPQFCLQGAGWKIDTTTAEKIAIDRPQPYDLPVIKLLSTRTAENTTMRGVFVYWFVADDSMSADPIGLERMSESAWKLLSTGVLQRWAYIYYFAICRPGDEDATFERMKKLIAESVPEFQLVPGAPAKALASIDH